MIVVSVAAVSALTVRRIASGATGWRTPSRIVARTRRGRISTPPLAIELTAAAIWSGVTPT